MQDRQQFEQELATVLEADQIRREEPLSRHTGRTYIHSTKYTHNLSPRYYDFNTTSYLENSWFIWSIKLRRTSSPSVPLASAARAMMLS